MDTIVALASARGRAGVAVVRVSGPRALAVCETIAGRVPQERVATLARFRDSEGGLIDHGLVLVFSEGHSFTGEAVCEFQVHGSVAVVSALLRACLALEGVRAADAGEFTRRAFLAGRMDLTEVEGLADLIDAETEGQRRQALRVMDGSAGRMIGHWREDLLQALAMLEAALDFADEDLPEDLTEHVLEPLVRVQQGFVEQLSRRRAAEVVREGFEIAIVGPVNAGKSTLLNALAGREAAITSARAGTTRDVIEVRMEIGSHAVTLIDTAGLRDATDEIERLGIDRGIARARAADLRIHLLTAPGEQTREAQSGDIVLLSKADLWGLPGLSGKTGEGIADLLQRIERELASRVAGSQVFSRERHFDQIERARVTLERAIAMLRVGATWELVGEDLRRTLGCLDGIVGRVDVEDVLGRIFSSFCIGK